MERGARNQIKIPASDFKLNCIAAQRGNPWRRVGSLSD